jgi:plasmid stabilization system protein ParE
MEKNRKLVWDRPVLNRLEEALKRIAETSFQNAEQVELAILEKSEITKRNSEYFPPDKYKENNTGNYRAFETHSFRVAYRYSETEVKIVQLRHVKQNPKMY